MKTRLSLLVTILVLGALLTACGPTTVYTQAEPPMRTITVTGTGMVTLTPDVAYIYIGVETQDASATKAMDDNNARAQAVIDAIKAFGVEDRDIQTTNFSIYPEPVYDDNYNQIGVTYVVNNTVYVTVRDLDKLGEILDASFRAGANQIYSISFDVADKTEAVSQARLAAVENARRQADELAAATGVTIGAVQTISYYDTTPAPIYYAERSADLKTLSSSVPVEPGSMQIVTTVTIVYEIH
jgi:uncharacterized protein YggE